MYKVQNYKPRHEAPVGASMCVDNGIFLFYLTLGPEWWNNLTIEADVRHLTRHPVALVVGEFAYGRHSDDAMEELIKSVGYSGDAWVFMEFHGFSSSVRRLTSSDSLSTAWQHAARLIHGHSPKFSISPSESVQNGSQVLDWCFPYWRNDNKIDQINIASLDHCILSRHFGTYKEGRASMPPGPAQFPQLYGFVPGQTPITEINQLWRNVMEDQIHVGG